MDILGCCQVISLRALFKRWLNCNRVRPRSRARAVSAMFATLRGLFHEGPFVSDRTLESKTRNCRRTIEITCIFECSAAGTMLAYFEFVG